VHAVTVEIVMMHMVRLGTTFVCIKIACISLRVVSRIMHYISGFN
jgi:hypothetical protein